METNNTRNRRQSRREDDVLNYFKIMKANDLIKVIQKLNKWKRVVEKARTLVVEL